MLPRNQPDRPRGCEVLPEGRREGSVAPVAAQTPVSVGVNKTRDKMTFYHDFNDCSATTNLVAVPQVPSSLELSGPDREAAQAVALYLGRLGAAGRSMASIEQARAPSPTFTPPPACRRPTTPAGSPSRRARTRPSRKRCRPPPGIWGKSGPRTPPRQLGHSG